MNSTQQDNHVIQLVDPCIQDDAESYDWHPDTVAACPVFDIHLPRILYTDMVNAVGVIPDCEHPDALRISDAWCNSNVWNYHDREYGGLNHVFTHIVAIFLDHLSMRIQGKQGVHILLGTASSRGNGRAGLSGKIWFMMEAVKNVLPLLHPVAAQDVHLKLKLSHMTACWSSDFELEMVFMDLTSHMINAAMLVAWCDLAERLSLHQDFHDGLSLAELVMNECNRLYVEHLKNQEKERLNDQRKRREEQKRQEQANQQADALHVAKMESLLEQQTKNRRPTRPGWEWKHTCCNNNEMTAEMAWGKEVEDSVIHTDTYYQSIIDRRERALKQRHSRWI